MALSLHNGGIRMEKHKDCGGLDYFRLSAAFLVIAIHTSPFSSFNNDIDFAFTRILARMAVPFFLMVTGYFLLPQYLFDRSKNYRPLARFLKKTLILYVIAICIYLPVNLYAGQLDGISFGTFLRLLLFDGTFYHLWYLPASVLGVLLLIFACRRLSYKQLTTIAALLYGIGLFGDSYYGSIAGFPFVDAIYQALFFISSHTRNGVFYVPIFLLIGAGIQHSGKSQNRSKLLIGFVSTVLVMMAEGLALHYLNVQRHDSMYIALPFCMYFLFRMMESLQVRPVKRFRQIATWIYLIHPLMIILVRGTAKFLHMEAILIENSMVHYITVCLTSFIFSLVLQIFLAGIHKKPFLMDRAWIEISRENLRHNVTVLRDILPDGCQMMPAVKANAYGHGAVLISRELNHMGVKAFCVATVSEGVELRRGGIKGDILILGYTHPEQFPLLRKYNLTQTVIDNVYAKVLDSYGKKIKVHIKIDTGMHRLGERADRISAICDIFKQKNLIVTGTFTHLSADESREEPDYSFTQGQAAAFYQVIEELQKQGYDCGKKHLLASYGLINYPELAGDYARIGIALYGVLSSRSDQDNCPVSLRPVLSIKARIALTKRLYTGETAGYGLQYTADKDQEIAVLAIGYADGIPRSLSEGKGKVLIHGKDAPIIGRICMDQMLVDINDIPKVTAGETAIIIGTSENNAITAYDLADGSGTITNEILSRLGNRLPRILI